MIERLPCSVKGCDRTILPSTAVDTGGRCMPCVQGRGPEGDTRPRRKVDRFQGVRDPVKVLKLLCDRPMPQPRTEFVGPPKPAHEYYAQLTPRQLVQMRNFAVAAVKSFADWAGEVASALACLTDVDMEPLLTVMLRHKMYEPAHAFRGAGPSVRDALLARIPSCGEQVLPKVLVAAAWVGDDEVVRQFADWQRESLRCLDSLEAPMRELTQAAGWELDENGRRRDLYSDRCHALVSRTDAQHDRVRTLIPRPQRCGSCDTALTDVLVLREPAGVLPLATCLACSEGTVRQFAEYNEHGEARWSQHSEVAAVVCPEREPLRSDPLQQGSGRPAHFAGNWENGVPCSQVGGLPSWLQSPDYVTCPACERTMRFVGQLAYRDFEPDGAGMIYTFACRRCQLTSAVYQQT